MYCLIDLQVLVVKVDLQVPDGNLSMQVDPQVPVGNLSMPVPRAAVQSVQGDQTVQSVDRQLTVESPLFADKRSSTSEKTDQPKLYRDSGDLIIKTRYVVIVKFYLKHAL